MKKLSPEGHRGRVRQRYLNEGLQSFQPHEVLEFLMFFTIPRRDTKQYTYDIITKHQNLNSLFSLSTEQLTKFSGVTEKTAELFHFLPEVWKCLNAPDEQASLFSYASVSKHLVSLFKNCETCDFVIILLDISGHAIFTKKLFDGDVALLEDYISEILELVSIHHASYVICAQNRPDSTHVYSDDIFLLNRLSFALGAMGVELRDHLIVSGNQTVSFILQNYLKFSKNKN